MPDPWEVIGPSQDPGAVNLRRADPNHPLDFFRGRDHLGRYLFTLQGGLAIHAGCDLPRFSSLAITLTPGASGPWSFTITLTDKAHVKVFRALCENLMAATRELEEGQGAVGVEVILGRLRRWQELLKALQQKLLTTPQVIGLFGEVLILRDVFIPGVSPLEAVSAWRGPHLEEQDFLLGEWMVEVKTQLVTSDSKLKISSENQLDSTSGKIMICHQTLGVGTSEEEVARTLNGLVDEVRGTLAGASSSALDQFEATLIAYGYQDKPEYGAERWTLNQRSYFHVTPEFPCITASMLPPGVTNVTYEIQVEACHPFQINDEEATSWVLGKT